MSKFIDLSVLISEDMTILPGDPKTKIEPASDFEKDGYRQNLVSICTHTGTHIDAPYHMLNNGKNLDQIPIDHFIGKGVYIKFDEAFDLTDIEEVDIREGDIVLFHTGMSNVYNQPEYFDNYPNIDKELASFLIAKRIKMVGVDMCSVDTKESFPVHKILLKNDILIIENLTNLALLKGKKFIVYALPLKLQVDGAPIRVVVEINEP